MQTDRLVQTTPFTSDRKVVAMSHVIVEQIFSEFARRLPKGVAKELAYAGNDMGSWKAIIYSARGAKDGHKVYLASEWLISVFEVFACAKLIPTVHDERLQAAIAALTEQPRRSDAASSWRLGLVGDYLQRPSETEATGNGDIGLAYRITEYISLVEEFQSSGTGRAFLQSASPLAGYSANLELEQLTQKLQRTCRRSGVTSPEVVDGAAQFMALVENCHSQLTELKTYPEVQSACWRFHGSLFTRRQAFQFGYSLLFGDEQLLRAGSPLVYRVPVGTDLEQDRLHTQEVEVRVARLQQIWLDLSTPQRWTKDGGALSWNGVVGLTQSPTGWYMQTAGVARG